MKTNKNIVTHPSQLNSLPGIAFFRTGGRGIIQLGGSIADNHLHKQWEKELNRHYYACGCSESAIGLIIGFLIGAVWSGYYYYQGMLGGGSAIWHALIVALVGAIIGKVIGRIRANAKLTDTIQQIQKHWHVEEKPEREHWTCG